MCRRTIQTSLALALSMAASASAGPVLLASWPIGLNLGTPRIITTARPAIMYFGPNNEFVSPLFEGLAPPPEFPSMLSEIVSRENDINFDGFVNLITNGRNDELHVLGWSPNGPIGGGGGLESSMHFVVPAFGPDLTGYDIEYIQEILVVDLQTPGSDPFGIGINTDWSVSGRYDFYGTPVPEMNTVGLLMIGVVGICVATWARRGRAGNNRCRFGIINAFVIICACLSVSNKTLAQCDTGGFIQVDGLKGSDNNLHDFTNQCFAASGTNVTIIVEAMADLGCNSFDASRNPPVADQCPVLCGGVAWPSAA